jgi:hypothetical protein
MTSRKRIQKYEKFGLQLTQAERKFVVDRVPSLPQGIVAAFHAAPTTQPIIMPLGDWKELAGSIASVSNDADDKKLQKQLDTIFSQIQQLLETHNYDEPSGSLEIKPPLVEESVQLAEWAAEMLIGAEQLGIKTRIVTKFPLPAAQRSVLKTLPIVSTNLKAKLTTKNPKLTVGEVGGLLIAVAEAMFGASPLQQLALILVAKRLKECLEAEVRGCDEDTG